MGEKGSQSPGLIWRKPLLYIFILSLLILSSCFLILNSTARMNSIDHSLLPNTKIVSVIENETRQPRKNGQSSDPESEKLITNSRGGQRQIFGNKFTESEVSVDTSNVSPEQELPICDPNKAILKVFMYDMPPEFHFGLLDWKPEGGSVWPDIRKSIPHYPGGLNLQHSIEYWLTLDLLSSRFANRRGPCSAVRVEDSREADVVFVPFFSSLSYNRHSKVQKRAKVSINKVLQRKLVEYITSQKEWKRSGGRDHVIMAHHPNSMLDARMKLWPCMFILADFGRYPPNVASVEKDVIAPYRHMIKLYLNDSSGFDDRPTLLYFKGAIYRKDGGFVRQELFYLLRGEKDVHFSFGSAQKNGVNTASDGMHSSKFCLNIAGDTPSSNRLFDAIASHCVPVIISDEIELPYEDVLDYSEFCIFVRTSDAVKKGFLMNRIRGIGREDWTRMWSRLKEIEKYFEYQYPSQKDDAVQMIWQAVARKVPAIRLKLNRGRRFSRTETRRQKLI